MYLSFGKRVFDLLFAMISLVILIPIFIVVGILIKLESKGPVFFIQTRLGENKKKIDVIKFRSMTHKSRDVEQQVYKSDPEITKVGYMIRRFKIDEMPQIFNVLKGEMSIIGPRPCLPSTPDKFDLRDSYRFMVKPGLSSIAGVNGSIYLTWEEKWYYDKYYVENLSLILDIKIVLKTILVIFSGEEKFLNRPKIKQDGAKKI